MCYFFFIVIFFVVGKIKDFDYFFFCNNKDEKIYFKNICIFLHIIIFNFPNYIALNFI
jgi:hypothetical protein